MMSPRDCDGIVQLKKGDWEAELYRQHLLAQLPRQRPRWRRWTGGGLLRIGRWLTRWGEQMVESECTQGVSVAG
jgi:hypothetical protein